MWELAQVNVAVMRAPLDDPAMAGFAAAFDRVARLAEQAPGFVWRLPSASGHEVVTDEDGAEEIVNVSVWQTYLNLHEFTYRSVHGRLLLRRGTWFLAHPPAIDRVVVGAGRHPTQPRTGAGSATSPPHPRADAAGLLAAAPVHRAGRAGSAAPGKPSRNAYLGPCASSPVMTKFLSISAVTRLPSAVVRWAS